MRFAVLIFVGVATTAGHDPVSSLATRRVALARAAAVAGTGLWRSAVLAEDSAAAAASEAYDASAVAPEVLPPPAPPAPPAISAFDFDVPFRGEPREITPFLGRANLLVNVKFDDPETLDQMPAIGDMVSRYSERGLHVLAFPTDQGWFEADDSNTLRLKYKSVYGFGQYPTAVVFDKTDLLGGNALPLYTWMTKTLSNPWGVDRLVFNYEKFLVDDRGQPRRRYPRKFPIQLMDADVRTARCWGQRPPAAIRRGTRPMHPPSHLDPPSPTCLVTERDWPFGFPSCVRLTGASAAQRPAAAASERVTGKGVGGCQTRGSQVGVLVQARTGTCRPLLRRPWRRAPTADTALDPLPAELLCDGLARLMNARGEDHTEEHVASHPGATWAPRRNVRGLCTACTPRLAPRII